MHALFLTIALLLSGTDVFAQALSVSSGSIERHENFPSEFVDARNVDVWLPDGYSAAKQYSVLYMHDGQMLFDASTTWNKQEWGVDETVAKLLDDGKIKDIIVVGIWNNGDYRHAEYYPEKSLTYLEESTRELVIKTSLKDRPRADGYLLFLTKELKPFIDTNYATRTDRNNTFIIGSSMGGLISIYALCEYPQVFGGAAGMSTHLPMLTAEVDKPHADSLTRSFRTYLVDNLPRANSRLIYFDYGDQTLDALYPPLQRKVDEIMREHGFAESHWITRHFAGEEHSEESWARRLDIPLQFLLAN